MGEQQMCLNCGAKPAVPSSGTVPLCADCAAQVSDRRGVKYEGPKNERRRSPKS
jgi:hypothetical protein